MKKRLTPDESLKRRLAQGRNAALRAIRRMRFKPASDGVWSCPTNARIRVVLRAYSLQVYTWRAGEERWRVFRRWLVLRFAELDFFKELRIALEDARDRL
ncbi:MAG: hypothetical protein IPK63_15580 [Candidatus Competibacteraceae bacterium]|nr:hypothetical protein [Candidatus Competibacteraceae bacterium]